MWATLWLVACTGSQQHGVPADAERAALLEALAVLPSDVEAAAGRCADIPAEARADCTWATVQAAPEHPRAAAWCDALPEGLARDECHFLRAEGSGALAECAHAGRFTDDCRLHLFSSRVQDLPRDTPLKDLPQAVSAWLDAADAVEDERFWSAALRWQLSRQLPLDRAACAGLSSDDWAQACRQTALAVYADRLNRARDFGGGLPCPGTPLPPRLAHTPDEELAAMRDTWRQRDGCSSR